MVRLNVALDTASSLDALRLLETFRFLMGTIRLEPGCVECTAWTDRELTVHYSESWETEADIQRRVRSPEFTSLLAIVECAEQPPLLQFEFVATTRGLDFVRECKADTGES